MNASVNDLMAFLPSVEQVVATSRMTDNEKREVLGELLASVPPEPFCRHCARTRAITIKIIEEAQNGFTTKPQVEKPVKSGARKTSAKTTKK